MIHGKRHRFRSTNRANCEAWLHDQLAKAGPITYPDHHNINNSKQ